MNPISPMPGAAGRNIGGKYRLIRRLGEGGMGSVYEAENLNTGGRVALKFLRHDLISRPELVKRFQQEARSAARIGHPHIVSVLDLDRDGPEGPYFIVEELLLGRDLREHLSQHKRLHPVEVIQIAVPVLSALAAAHDVGVIHRDIKPPNIFLSTNPLGGFTPKVIDFGVSRVQDLVDGERTRTGTLLGTPAYMSPEQLAADPSIDGRSDVWAMGIVLYEMLAGATPFPAPSPSNLVLLAEFVQRVRFKPAPPLSLRAPEVPAPLAAVVMKALEIDRDRRFPTMRAFMDALVACAGQFAMPANLPGGALAGDLDRTVTTPSPVELSLADLNAFEPVPDVYARATVQHPGSPSPPQAPEPPPDLAPRRTLLWIGLAAATGVSAVGAFFGLGSGTKPARTTGETMSSPMRAPLRETPLPTILPSPAIAPPPPDLTPPPAPTPTPSPPEVAKEPTARRPRDGDASQQPASPKPATTPRTRPKKTTTSDSTLPKIDFD